MGHDLPDRDRRFHILPQNLYQLLVHVIRIRTLDQRRCRGTVTATAKSAGNLTHVHCRARTAGDELNLILEHKEQKRRIRVKHIIQLVRQRGKLVQVLIQVGSCDQNGLAVPVVPFHVFHQLAVDGLIPLVQWMVQDVSRHGKVGTLLQ